MAQLDLLTAAPPRAQGGLADRSPSRHIDPILAITSMLLTVYGLFMVYSATHKSLTEFGQDPGYYLKKQAIFLVLGVAAMVATENREFGAVEDAQWSAFMAELDHVTDRLQGALLAEQERANA